MGWGFNTSDKATSMPVVTGCARVLATGERAWGPGPGAVGASQGEGQRAGREDAAPAVLGHPP